MGVVNTEDGRDGVPFEGTITSDEVRTITGHSNQCSKSPNEGPIAQWAHVAAGDAKPSQFNDDMMATRAGNAERTVPPACRRVAVGSG